MALFIAWSRGQGVFFGVVKGPRGNFSGQEILTPVAGLSMMHIGVTTPCYASIIYSLQSHWGYDTTNSLQYQSIVITSPVCFHKW